jgi:biopolymer transport protein TolR
MAKVAARGRGRRTVNEINMVPFIDVMLVLLIIFMVTAPLITPSVIDVPSVGRADRQPDHFVVVTIDKDGALAVRDSRTPDGAQPVTERELGPRVKELQQAASVADGAAVAPVIISADKTLTYETVIKTMDRLQRAGVARVGLSVQQQP